MNAYQSPRNSRNQPRQIGGIVDKIVRSLGMAPSYYGWQFVSGWPEIVGERIARVAQAVSFDGGTLYVAVEDDAWRQELSMELETIIAKIQGMPHGQVVKTIRLVRGEKGNRE